MTLACRSVCIPLVIIVNFSYLACCIKWTRIDCPSCYFFILISAHVTYKVSQWKIRCVFLLVLVYIGNCLLLVAPVDQIKGMLGTFAPRRDPYEHLLEEETTPSGVLARGIYSAKLKVLFFLFFVFLLAASNWLGNYLISQSSVVTLQLFPTDLLHP